MLENIDAQQAVNLAKQAAQRGDPITARRLAFLAACLDPADVRPPIFPAVRVRWITGADFAGFCPDWVCNGTDV